ncbi:MAG: acetate--CoA ligase family protein [Rhodospirillaceae bacterium]|nr:acetate--CoA ligase family protein [Rhodospirillaceae bacterium]MBT5809578.1 acetate--CoA ligase family protein [Rhodospirillaceae bacterium]
MDTLSLIASARADGRVALDEFNGKRILAGSGLTVPKGVVVDDETGLESALTDLSPPFALKAVSADIIHKSDSGAVVIGLKDSAAAAEAMGAMRERLQPGGARIDGYLIEEMAAPGHELVMGAVRDPQFGPLVMIGLGGVFVEIFEDVAFRIFPLTRHDAFDMLGELKAAPVLAGARGGGAVNRDLLVDALMKFGGENGLLAKHGNDFSEIDINPLIVSRDAAVAVDARFVLAPS